MKQLKATVIKVEAIEPHPRADKLEIIRIKGHQTVVGNGEFKAGNLAAWIPAGLVVPDRPEYVFLSDPRRYYRYGSITPYVPDTLRTIRPRKFRGEWSVGLLMPLSKHKDAYAVVHQIFNPLSRLATPLLTQVQLGQDITELLDITNPNKIVNRERLKQAGVAVLKHGLQRGYERGLAEGHRVGFQDGYRHGFATASDYAINIMRVNTWLKRGNT